jgi:spermidine/putrescine transport system ATP-binding protein
MDNAGTAASQGLKVQDISKRFGKVEVLRNISISIEPGEFITLLGPSGCGKTTLLRIIAGLEMADSGLVLLSGRDLTPLPANRRPVNTVFQSYALFPHLSVADNVAFGLRAKGTDAPTIKKRVDDALAMLHLEDFGPRYPHQLSGGQKQRVAMARALVNEPEVLLLDEPMSALDAKLRAEVQIELRRLQQRLGKTFVLVTHDQDEAMTVSDRIFLMRGGRIEQSGAPTEIYEKPVSRFVAEFLGSANLIEAKKNADGSLQTVFGQLRTSRDAPWTEGTLVIRPERIRLASAEPGPNALQVCIRESIYRGDHLDLWVEPGPLRIRTAPNAPVKVGDTMWAQLPPEDLEVLID